MKYWSYLFERFNSNSRGKLFENFEPRNRWDSEKKWGVCKLGFDNCIVKCKKAKRKLRIKHRNFFQWCTNFLFVFFFHFRFVHPLCTSENSRFLRLFVCILVQIVSTMIAMLAAELPPPYPGADPLCGYAPREGSRSWAFITRIERWISGGLVLRPTRCASMRLEVLLPK